MSPQEAFDNQLILQLGNACLTIAKQAAAVTELQNALAERDAKIAELTKEDATVHELRPA